MQPIFTTTARQNGNPTISLYPDRVEWRLRHEGFIKWLAYIITLGLAALFPLDQRKIIPIKSITRVDVNKESRWRTRVTVVSRTFGTIKVRLRAEDAEAFLNHLSALSI